MQILWAFRYYAPEDGRLSALRVLYTAQTFFEPLARVAGKITRYPRAFVWA
ncbi:MAG: hypothetical protein LBK44_04130 [Spirochaetales bacterium]|nr:hypothetical protein [Spirochaetales bacterium]